MRAEFRDRITQVLRDLRASDGDTRQATDWLFTVLYDELRSMAHGLMRGERAGHTLQPTALVNEAYMKLVGRGGLEWENRSQFLAIAARAMRQVLVNYARSRNAARRAGGREALTISTKDIKESDSVGGQSDIDVLILNDALNRLFDTHERMGQVVELKMFAGLKEKEIAHVLAVSIRTVANDWSFAKAWLSRELGGAV